MKDLILVTAHCPTEEQEMMLEKCIDSINKFKYHILLVSHTHVPIHIQKKCNYYFYDYLNDVSDDYNYLGYSNYISNDWEIQSRFFNKYFYGFAIYRMISIACQIAINFKYEFIHHIEYDCELIDDKIILENDVLLTEYDSVLYTGNGKKDGFLFGSFKSLKVNSLPDKYKNYDREFIADEMKKLNQTYLEFLTKKLFLESGSVFFKNDKELHEGVFSRGKYKLYHRGFHYTLFYNNKSLNLFYKNNKNEIEKITVIVNEKKLHNLQIKPDFWHIENLGDFDNIDSVRIDNQEKILYDIKFDTNFREIFKIKSYSVEKNN